MSENVRLLVDPGARRWQLLRVDATGQSTPVPTGDPGIALGRDSDGAVVEMVIDQATLGPAALARVAEHFGPAVRDELALIDPTVITERVLHSERQLTTGVVQVAPARSCDEIVSVVRHGHRIRATLLHTVGIAAWVRVRSARTGALVAVAPIQQSGNDAPVVEFTFGLDVELDDLRFEPTDNPFPADDDYRSSITTRIDDLLAEAERAGRVRPGRGARIADGAALLANSINDDPRRRVASAIARGLRRSLRARMVAAVALIAAIAFVAITTASGRSPSNSSPTTSSESSPGPLISTYPSGDSVLMAMVGATPQVVQGSTWPVGAIEFTTRETGVFGDVAEGRVAAEQRCAVGTPLKFTAGALSQVMAMVELWPVGIDSGSPILIGPVPANPQQDFLEAIPETCGDLTEIDGKFIAEYSLKRAGQSAIFDVPTTITPGLWEAKITLENQQPDSVIGAIVLEVADGE